MEKVKNFIKTFNINKKYHNYIIYFYCLLCSIIFLSICSKSSFLYPLNNWDDANSFFTMGKGMANGLIIYKDLFEQKGPLLYLIHAIAYIISNKTFIGIFIFEVISFSIFLYFANKTILLYFRKIHILWASPLMSFIILSSYVFISGDSAEEFCLPLLAISLYYFLNYYKNIYPQKMPTKQVIFNGVMAGLVMVIKYNLLGFWLGFAGFLCIGLLINKKVKEAFLSGLYFLFGMLIVALPWIIYFALNNALYEMIDVYFFVNISAYSENVSILNRILTAFKSAYGFAGTLMHFSIITFLGYIYVIFSKTIIPNKYGKFAITFTIFLTILGVYYGANHVYYFLILMTFIVLGTLFIANVIEKILKPKLINYTIFLTPIYILSFVILTCNNSVNYDFHNIKKEDLLQYQFAQIIEKKENPTLLNYGFLDGGFYTVTNITPNVKYFHKPNIKYENYPEIMDEQNRYIKDSIIDFVVLKLMDTSESTQIPYLYENYEEVKTIYISDVNSYYMLFQIKDKDEEVIINE